MSVEAMIAAAEADLGTGEPNHIHDWYNAKFGNPTGTRNWPWCNGAVTYWAHKSGNAEAVCFGPNGHFAYTVAHAEQFQRRGQWYYGTAGIRRGDIVFFDWGGRDSIAAIDHVGIVTSVDGSRVHTIEGNIEDACKRKVRGAHEIAGYGRPNYKAAAPPQNGGNVAVVYFEDVRMGGPVNDSTREVQKALNKVLGAGLLVDGDYGPVTMRAYKRWQESLFGPGPDSDGVPGLTSMQRLAARAGFELRRRTTPPPTTPSKPLEGRTVKFADVRLGAPKNDSVRVVQTALNHEFGNVVVDGDFGPQSSAAYKRWQESLYGPGPSSDGIPGADSLGKLAAKYGFKVTGDAPAPPPPAPGEPAHDYARTTHGGKVVNKRTDAMIHAAQDLLGHSIGVTQGSYNRGGVSASAGTHDGGGAIDVPVNGWSTSKQRAVVQALRKVGFAAWLRTPSQGPWAAHIHAIAIGDREASSGAKSQVRAYFNGRDGLARNGADTDAPRPYPAWAAKYR